MARPARKRATYEDRKEPPLRERMQVPFIDLARQVRLVADAAHADFRACLDGCDFVGGPRVATLERALTEAAGAPHAVACASGTAALILGLEAMGVERGAKVAVPDLTFFATYEAVVRAGAEPVLVDVDPDDLQMSLEGLARAREEHGVTAAVLVHLFGWASSRLGEIRAYAREHGVALLEDGAQSFGVEVDGAPILAGAEVGTLSFYPAKVIGGAMDGGAVLTRGEGAARTARTLLDHGRSSHYGYERVGWNFRMGAMQAAYLIRVLERREQILEDRRRTARFYEARLGSGSPRVRVHGPPPGVRGNGYLNVTTVEGMPGDALAAALRAAGIGCARTYPAPLSAQRACEGALRAGDLPVARDFCARVINLPLFFGITEAEREAAAASLLEAIR